MATNVVFLRSMQFLGGHLVTYPLLYQLRQLFPNDQLHVVGTDPVGSHYECTPWVDSYIQAGCARTKLAALKGVSRSFVLHYSSEQYAFLTFLRRIGVRSGFLNGRVGDFLWTHCWKKDPNEYLGLANLQLARQLNDFCPEGAARGAMAALATQADPALPLAQVVFMPGGGAGAYKRWHIESYVALADALKAQWGLQSFCFVTGPGETREADYIAGLGRPDFQVARNRSMADIARLCLHARLMVANDCGPSHIAQSTAGRYVGLFQDHEPQWFWRRKGALALTPNNGTCDIQSITVARVAQACGRLLGEGELIRNSV